MSKNAKQLIGSPVSLGTGANGVKYSHIPAGNFITTTLTFSSVPVTVANTTGASFGSLKIFDFPQVKFYLIGGKSNFTFTWTGESIVATGSGDYSLGTTATADATLSSTDVDIQASTAMLDPFVAGVGTGSGFLVSPTAFDGSSTAKDIYLNMIIDDADVSDADTDTVLVSGTVTMQWALIG